MPTPSQPDEGDQQVAAEHQDEHRGDEQVHVQEELGVVLVALHVPDRVQVDQGADAGDEQHHGHRQRVDVEGGVDLEAVDRDPRPQVLAVVAHRLVQLEQGQVDPDRHHERGAHHDGGRPRRRPGRPAGGRRPAGRRSPTRGSRMIR